MKEKDEAAEKIKVLESGALDSEAVIALKIKELEEQVEEKNTKLEEHATQITQLEEEKQSLSDEKEEHGKSSIVKEAAAALVLKEKETEIETLQE